VTVAEAQAAGRDKLVATLGDRAGAWLHDRTLGVDPSVVEPREQQKSVSREDTFARDIGESDVLERELQRLAVRVSADLRKQSLEARTVTVKVRDRTFATRSAQRSLVLPIASEQSVFRVARSLLRKLRRSTTTPVRLLGISLSHFEGRDAEAAQLGLFDEAPATAPVDRADEAGPIEGDRERALTKALDRIRERFGASAIVPAQLVDKRADPGPRVEDEPE
jgi:DNA polymerase-4